MEKCKRIKVVQPLCKNTSRQNRNYQLSIDSQQERSRSDEKSYSKNNKMKLFSLKKVSLSANLNESQSFSKISSQSLPSVLSPRSIKKGNNSLKVPEEQNALQKKMNSILQSVKWDKSQEYYQCGNKPIQRNYQLYQQQQQQHQQQQQQQQQQKEGVVKKEKQQLYYSQGSAEQRIQREKLNQVSGLQRYYDAGKLKKKSQVEKDFIKFQNAYIAQNVNQIQQCKTVEKLVLNDFKISKKSIKNNSYYNNDIQKNKKKQTIHYNNISNKKSVECQTGFDSFFKFDTEVSFDFEDSMMQGVQLNSLHKQNNIKFQQQYYF